MDRDLAYMAHIFGGTPKWYTRRQTLAAGATDTYSVQLNSELDMRDKVFIPLYFTLGSFGSTADTLSVRLDGMNINGLSTIYASASLINLVPIYPVKMVTDRIEVAYVYNGQQSTTFDWILIGIAFDTDRAKRFLKALEANLNIPAEVEPEGSQ